MPLLVPATPAVIPPTPPAPLPATVPAASAFVTWTPAGGATRILSATAPFGIMLGGVGGPGSIIGLDMPAEEQFDTDLAVGNGQLMNHRRFATRQVALPIVIHADQLEQLETYRRELLADFNPVSGEGVLTLAYPDGSRRHLNARYSSGLDVAEQGRMGGPLYFDSYVMILKARDPLPYGDEQSITFDPPEDFQFFAPPGDPQAVVYISSSTTTGDSTVKIDGEVEVWPEWRLRGPITTAQLRNRDTGKTLDLTPNLSAGQTLTIRTDPRTPPLRKFTRETAVSVWSSVAGQFPVMWSLLPGDNDVTVLLAGTVPGQSSATLTYRPRFLSS